MGEENAFPDVVMPQCPVRKILRGQTALVTGANSVIGRSVALHLGKEGALSHTGEQRVSRCYSHAHQSGGMGDAGRLRGSDAADPLRPHR